MVDYQRANPRYRPFQCTVTKEERALLDKVSGRPAKPAGSAYVIFLQVGGRWGWFESHISWLCLSHITIYLFDITEGIQQGFQKGKKASEGGLEALLAGWSHRTRRGGRPHQPPYSAAATIPCCSKYKMRRFLLFKIQNTPFLAVQNTKCTSFSIKYFCSNISSLPLCSTTCYKELFQKKTNKYFHTNKNKFLMQFDSWIGKKSQHFPGFPWTTTGLSMGAW